MDLFPPEEIAGMRFSALRPESGPAQPRPKEFRWGFWLVVVLFLGASVGLGIVAQQRGEAGDAEGVTQMAWWFLVLVCLPFLAMPWLALRRRQNRSSPPLPPAGIPGSAIPALAATLNGNASRVRSKGWLWVEGPWLVFKGDRFDFRLARRDFRWKKSLARRLLRDALPRLELPKSLPATTLRVYAGFDGQDGWAADRDSRDRLEPLLAGWETASPPREPSLFPSLRRELGPAMLAKPSRWIPIAVGSGMAMAGVLKLARPEVGWGELGSGALVIAAYVVFFFVGLPALERWQTRSVNRAIDKAKGVGPAPTPDRKP